MITFQAIIDEARRQKNIIALDFYNMLKEEQMDYDKFDLVAYFENEGSETAVCFGVDTWVENASYCENNIKLATINVEDFDEGHELSFKNVLTSLEEQLDDFEKALHKKMRVKVESSSISFEYKDFWVESESFDQAENGHPEDGITFTSYVWHSKEERDALEDQIESLVEVYDNPEELEKGVKKAIDKYIKKRGKQMMQVVYNNQFGGFGLSDEALSLLSERKGVKFDEYLASELPRHDPDLIKVVSELGSQANTNTSSLTIKELSSSYYKIVEVDGRERVIEPDLGEYVKIDL